MDHTLNKWSHLGFASHWVAAATYVFYLLIWPTTTTVIVKTTSFRAMTGKLHLLVQTWPVSVVFFLFVLKSKFLSLLDLILEEAACIFLFFVLFRFLFCSLYFCGLAFNCFYLWRHNDILQILWLYKSWVLCKLVHYTARCVVFGQLVRWVCI